MFSTPKNIHSLFDGVLSPEGMMSISANNILFKNLSEKINIIGNFVCNGYGIKEIKKGPNLISFDV